MRRVVSSSFAAAAILLLLVGSGSLLAQTPTPTPPPGGPAAGPGPWSVNHPLWFDLNGDGSPQDGEITGHPRQVVTDCTKVVEYPADLGSPESPCALVFVKDGVGGSILRPSGTTQSLVSNPEGTFFTFTEEPLPVPTGAGGVRALAPTAAGTGQLFDTNGDGIYDSLDVQGTNSGGSVPVTRISLLPRDATGDGRPDYITLPWTTSGAGMLGVFTDSTPQIYVPLTDTDADGWPDTVTVEVEFSAIATTTGPPVSGSALANGIAVPSGSSLGLFLFAAAVVALGVKLLRGSVVGS